MDEILYKVVGKEHRYGSNMTAWMLNENKSLEETKEFLEQFPNLKPYFPRYVKKTVIEEVPYSPGLLCFSSKTAAGLFINTYTVFQNKIVIIKVQSLSWVDYYVPPRSVISGGMKIMNLVLRSPEKYSLFALPEGTVGVKKLLVLE